MARSFGKDVRVYLGSRDASADLTTVSISGMADVEDSTTFNNAGAHGFDSGLLGWEAELTGFYDGAASGVGQQFETLLGATGGIISVYDGSASAIGSKGILLSDGILAKRGQPIEVASLIKLTGSLKAAGNAARPGLFGVLLHVLGAEATTGVSASVDNSASSANGGRANLHVTAATGTGGIVAIKAGTDNVTFGTTLATFTTTAVPVAQTIEFSGTVPRYIRCEFTINGASSLTFVAGFARY